MKPYKWVIFLTTYGILAGLNITSFALTGNWWNLAAVFGITGVFMFIKEIIRVEKLK